MGIYARTVILVGCFDTPAEELSPRTYTMRWTFNQRIRRREAFAVLARPKRAENWTKPVSRSIQGASVRLHPYRYRDKGRVIVVLRFDDQRLKERWTWYARSDRKVRGFSL